MRGSLTGAVALSGAVSLLACAACAAGQGSDGGGVAPAPASAQGRSDGNEAASTATPTQERSGAKALAFALVPSSFERPSAEQVRIEECPLAAGETVSCVTFTAWTTALPIGERRRLFLDKARNARWTVLREEATPGKGLLIYLARPRYRARVGLAPDGRECSPCGPVMTEILVAGPRSADGEAAPAADARDSEFAAAATRVCRELLHRSRAESPLSPGFLDELRRGIDDLERVRAETGGDVRVDAFLAAMRQVEVALGSIERAKGEASAEAGALALERAREAAVAARELDIADCARLF